MSPAISSTSAVGSRQSATGRDALSELFERGNVIVCCGTGGVGKTSVAACLGISAAERGIPTVVVTVDPARRLASALGLADTGNEVHGIEGVGSGGGSLDIVMLDARAMFDAVIRAEAATPAQATAILENAMYRSIAGALGGTQEYMAAELLHQLLETKRYGLIIVDTPPSRHALDLLDAPKRITRLLDNRLVRLLLFPARTTMKAAGGALNAVLKTLGKVIGGAVLTDTVAFLRSFDGMEDGFRLRARVVDQMLGSSSTSYVIVTSTQPEPVREAMYFYQALVDRNRTASAVIVNQREPLRAVSAELREELAAISTAAGAASGTDVATAAGATAISLLTHAIGEHDRAAASLEPFSVLAPSAVWFGIPRRADDVHDVAGLRWMSDQIAPVS